jgi:hypothetical protein
MEIKELLAVDPLAFWSGSISRHLPIHRRIASKVLSIQPATGDTESMFSVGRRTTARYRSSLSPKRINRLVSLNRWHVEDERLRDGTLSQPSEQVTLLMKVDAEGSFLDVSIVQKERDALQAASAESSSSSSSTSDSSTGSNEKKRQDRGSSRDPDDNDEDDEEQEDDVDDRIEMGNGRKRRQALEEVLDAVRTEEAELTEEAMSVIRSSKEERRQQGF